MYIEKIFERATMRGIADYLLFGSGPDEDNRSYEERLEEPYLRFEKAVAKYDKNPTSELLDLSNEVTSETASVYMEIGIQVGFLLMMDIIKNVKQVHSMLCTRYILRHKTPIPQKPTKITISENIPLRNIQQWPHTRLFIIFARDTGKHQSVTNAFVQVINIVNPAPPRHTQCHYRHAQATHTIKLTPKRNPARKPTAHNKDFYFLIICARRIYEA